MTVQKLIEELQKCENKDLPVCIRQYHEYWGNLEHEIDFIELDKSAQPDGPKSGKLRASYILS